MTLERFGDGEYPLAPATGFSHAVRLAGPCQLVFLAGQTALTPEGSIKGATLVEQFEQAFTNLLVALTAAGGTAADLVTMTVYAVDVEQYRLYARELGAVWRRLAGRDYPAMAVVGVTRLWDAEALVELQAVAAVAVAVAGEEGSAVAGEEGSAVAGEEGSAVADEGG